MHGSSTLDYDAVPASLADAAVTPGDPAYGRLTSTYFRGGAPGIMLLPRTVEQVVDAVDFAGRHLHLPLGIRSGGHGLGGRSTNDGGIVIDLRHLNGIHVLDPAAQLVRIGPGARWRDVAAALQPPGWALSSGDSGAVGVGGLATSGGIGLLARAHGLTIDRLVAAHVVLADGSTEPTTEEPLDGVWSQTSPASTRRTSHEPRYPAGTRGGRQPGTGGPIGRWLTKRVMNRVRRKGEAMGMGFNALVLTTIRCTSGRERNAVASMVGRDPR